MRVEGRGERAQGSRGRGERTQGFRVQGFRVQGSGFKGSRVQGSGFRVQGGRVRVRVRDKSIGGDRVVG